MRSIRIITAASLSFFLLLILSGVIGGTFGNILYYLALPVTGFSALYLCRKDLSGESMLSIRGNELIESAAYIFPTVLAVMAVSYITGLFFSLFGISTAEQITGPLPKAILVYALYPAVFEELFFRYIPLRLSDKIPRGALVAVSSVAFALVHADLTALPFALLAGIIFILVDLKYKSVIPSLIMHFINNLSSVLYMLYSEYEGFALAYFGVISLLAALSIPFIIKMERGHDGVFSNQLRGTFGKPEYYKELFALAIPTMLVAVVNLL